MEITKVFKACVKAAKLKCKDIPSNDILPKTKHVKSSISSKALELAGNITKLKVFLLKHQTEYLGEFSHLISISSKMTEEERDQIDTDAQTFITACSNTIVYLKSDVKNLKETDQSTLHYKAIVELLELYLKDVCKLYSQQRAYRVKQTVDRKRLSRLKPEKSSTNTLKEPTNTLSEENKQKTEVTASTNQTEKAKNETYNKTILLEENKPKEVFTFSPEETQMLEEENERLYDEMNNVVKEIKNIEGKVIEIGRLQEIFQEKILSQSTQIENIQQTAVSTTENVKDGNEQIREAIKNSASFRVWVLFFLVMCTFSLLFLDWYNP